MAVAIRNVEAILKSKPTLEGAGVRLHRAFGLYEVPKFDPFLLLDDIHSDDPADYMAGFPRHPHRGIETVTYVIAGRVRHRDSLGNGGVIEPGDVQWMTAGSGIIHSEMPDQEEGLLWGFQLWANLPASHKMMDPRYRGIESGEIPEVVLEGTVRVKVIAGRLAGVEGPVQDIVTDPEYLDVTVPAGGLFGHEVGPGYTALSYVIEGGGRFDGETGELAEERSCLLFGDGDRLEVAAGERGVRFLLVSGKPIGEPVAWRGPIVMNTEEELRTAFEEYSAGTFIKVKGG